MLPKYLSHIANIVPTCAFGSAYTCRKQRTHYTFKRETKQKKEKTRKSKNTWQVCGLCFVIQVVLALCTSKVLPVHSHRTRKKNICFASVLQWYALSFVSADTFQLFSSPHTNHCIPPHGRRASHTAEHSRTALIVVVTAQCLHDRTNTTSCGPEEIIHHRTEGTKRNITTIKPNTRIQLYNERAATRSV